MKKLNKNAIVASAVAVMFMAMLVVPIIDRQGHDELEIIDDTTLGWIDWNPIKHGISAPFQWGSDGLSWIAEQIRGEPHRPIPPGGTGNIVEQFARDLESLSTQEKVMLVAQLASSLIDNDRQVFALSELHFNRSTEITSAMIWFEGASFNSDDILLLSGVLSTLGQANHNTQYSLDWAFDQAANRIDIWATNDWATGLEIRLGWNGGTTAGATDRLNLDFSSIMTATASANVFYLDTDSMTGNTGPVTNHAAWSFSPNGSFTYMNTGLTFPLNLGYNDISAMPSGWYTATAGIYAGPFLISTSPAAAAIVGGAVIICDDTTGYVTVDSNTGMLRIHYEGEYTSSFIRYGITADGNTRWTEDLSDGRDPVASAIISYSKYFEQIKELQFRAASAALTMWMISANAHQSNILLSPSAVIPQLTTVGVDAVQAYAMYIGALEQIAAYWNNNGTLLRAADVRISAESLDLYLFGSVYNPDGTVIASNVVFTPYVYTQNMNVRIGHNTFATAGMIMVWDDTSATAIGWTGASTNNARTLTVLPGVFFEATEVVHKGDAVQSITLQVKTIEATGIMTNAQLGLSEAPKVLNVTMLFMIIFVLIGVILFLIGINTESRAFKLIGLIVAIVGFLAADFLARFLLAANIDALYATIRWLWI